MRICPKCGSEHADEVSFCDKDGTQLTNIDAAPDSSKAGTGGEAKIGSVLGSYRLVNLLGEGGMGFVYLAEHTRLGRQVALKMLRPEYAANTNVVKRFFGEARAVNQINHENIVEITDFIENEGSENYYIMELLKGASLAELQLQEGTLPTERSLRIAIQICAALAAVHEGGIVHRDLKPDNVFLTNRAGQEDFVKLLDFGVAKLQDVGEGRSLAQTSAGAVLGTPEYMSPEQVSGKDIDYRTDIYALGVILYEMVTGRKPLSAKTFGEMVIKQMTVVPPKPSKLKDLQHPIPVEFERLILGCLEKEPDKRPQNMTEVTAHLKAILGDSSAEAESFVPVRRTRHNLTKLIPVAAAVVVIAFAGVGWAVFGGDSKPSEATGVAAQDEEAPAPAKIQLSFDSTPRGAEVFREGETDPLGLTPFTIPIEESTALATFEFRLDGYKTATQKVGLRETARVATTLAKAPKAKRRRGRKARAASDETTKEAKKTKPKKRRRRDLRGTIDPFAD